MIADTLQKIRERIQGSTRMDPDNKAQLMDLIEQLNMEIQKVEGSDKEQAESVANFTNLSTHEVSKEQYDEDLVNLSIDGLGKSVRKFEVTHPELTEVVNKIAYLLQSMGI